MESAYINALNAKTKIKPQPIAQNNDNDADDDDQPDGIFNRKNSEIINFIFQFIYSMLCFCFIFISDVFDSQTGQMSVTNDWWKSHLSKEDLETILPSNKLIVLFEILNQCLANNEKCLIFSAFVAVLDVVEYFMLAITQQHKTGIIQPELERFRKQKWEYAHDFYRLDGKTPKQRRHEMITSFNDPSNQRIKAFLISAKAGGQGINLIGANRVVLLDTSWNPSNDRMNFCF